MNLTQQEQATIAFYDWESMGRGYVLFDSQVHLEPPFKYFVPFVEKTRTSHFDDGRVPSLLESIKNWIAPPQISVPKQEKTIIRNDESVFLRKEISLKVPRGTDISVASVREFLTMLSTTKASVAFEILSHKGTLDIRFVVAKEDEEWLCSMLKAYFPTIILRIQNADSAFFDTASDDIAIVDFGYDSEYMLPISQASSFQIDPLTSIIAFLASLHASEIGLFQVIFKGVNAPWTSAIRDAVSDGRGGAFFAESPEILKGSQQKLASPLMAVVFRVALQTSNLERTRQQIRQFVNTIHQVSQSEYNSLIPLSNENYPFEYHLENVFARKSNRVGAVMSVNELATFIHYPNKTVHEPKIGLNEKTNVPVAYELRHGSIYLGESSYAGESTDVYIQDEHRLRHTHIMGATGTGKSTLLTHIIGNDVALGNSIVLFDPHGDIAEDVLARIPEPRLQDVILLDPADTDFPMGLNILEAHSETEKIVLASDIVATFKRYATSWGDTMTSVLQNAVITFVESEHRGNLVELKQFLIDDALRQKVLATVEDPVLHNYWQHEYPIHKKSISPLLTRIDTFLRPKIIRYMFAQSQGFSLDKAIQEKKIIIIKLSQGLIGEENSYLLGSLLLTKLYQIALRRQQLSKTERTPFFVYLDEFQHFITPSMGAILSGARKYGLGLTLVHQELSQIDDIQLRNSLLTNPAVRVCFRVGEQDAKLVESNFAHFSFQDILQLPTGEALLRVERSDNDVRLITHKLNDIQEEEYTRKRDAIVAQCREQYSTPKSEIEKYVNDLLTGKKEIKTPSSIPIVTKEKPSIIKKEILPKTSIQPKIEEEETQSFEEQKEKYLASLEEREQISKHRTLQIAVRNIAHEFGYSATLEEVLPDDTRIDVVLVQNDTRIAVEIARTNTVEYEVHNLLKAIKGGFEQLFCISENPKHLTNIENQLTPHLQAYPHVSVRFGSLDTLRSFLSSKKVVTNEKRVRGYRVQTSIIQTSSNIKQEERTHRVREVILQSLQSKR